ncbi:MAG TPA: YdcF family protein [Elainellaceae cyanobacterium]
MKFHWVKLLRWLGSLIAVGVLMWTLVNVVVVWSAASRPVDTILVLGGSIQREMYVAELAQVLPDASILISGGSVDPCIWLIFQRAGSPVDQVWLEKCADSTFDNFYYSTPILKQWTSRHVKLVTSETHLPRAEWLGKILLGSHGMWVELDIAPEQGVPGNRESWLKTTLDVIRSVGWAVLGQWIHPTCDDVVPLSSVDIEAWRHQGFKCEHQGNLD